MVLVRFPWKFFVFSRTVDHHRHLKVQRIRFMDWHFFLRPEKSPSKTRQISTTRRSFPFVQKSDVLVIVYPVVLRSVECGGTSLNFLFYFKTMGGYNHPRVVLPTQKI